MPKPPRPVAKPAQRFEPEKHSCYLCGGMAPFGIGPPLQDPPHWYCHPHWLWQPSTVAHFAALLREIMRDETDGPTEGDRVPTGLDMDLEGSA